MRSPSPLLLPARTRPRGFTVSSTRDDPEETGGDPSTALDLGQKQADTPDEPMRPPSPSSDAEDDNEPDHAEADGGPPEHMVDELVDDESREAATVMQSLALPRIVLHPPSSPMAEQPSPVHPPDRVDTPSSVAAARASSPTLESTPQSSVPTSPGPGSCSPEVQHDTGVGTLMPHVNAAQEAFFASSREAQEEFEVRPAQPLTCLLLLQTLTLASHFPRRRWTRSTFCRACGTISSRAAARPARAARSSTTARGTRVRLLFLSLLSLISLGRSR